MKITTIALASALALTGTLAVAQSGAAKGPSAQGAPTGAAVDSTGNSTSPGAVKSGTSAGGAASVNSDTASAGGAASVNSDTGVTTGASGGACLSNNQLPKLVLGVTFNNGIEVIAKPTDRQPETAAA